MGRHYNYTDAKYQQVGEMICSVCNKRITEGEYRYYAAGNVYIQQHRACCADDEMWAKLDVEHARQYKQACQDFVKQWGMPDIEDFEKVD